MCGIAGIVDLGGRAFPGEAELRHMIVQLRHRGPDGYGFHRDGAVGLAHARLSIIDLSGGSQPNHNEDKTVWVVFNGEIFNYLELRRPLQERGHRFRTASDTEVLVHLYEARSGQVVTAALYEAGYSSSSRLYEGANGKFGMTPASVRRGGRDMNIRYTPIDSPLGRLLVAATDRGICDVSFGDEDAALEAALATEYPAANLERDGAYLGTWVQTILAHLDGRRPHLDLPLDVQATAFQERVWAELRRIPAGETRSYAQVAEAIGQPAAVRAVAHACASNPVALVTPCHRVLRSDGSLGGYRWGLQRKQALLEAEKDQE